MQACPFPDKDRLNDLLNTEKQLVSSYSTYACEAACPKLRQIFTNNQNQTLQDQFTAWTAMNERGWYPVKNADPQQINQAKQDMKAIHDSLQSC